jgi:hypothetical protein
MCDLENLVNEYIPRLGLQRHANKKIPRLYFSALLIILIPLGTPRRRDKDDIKMDLQEVGCGVWTGLSWLRIETGGRHL